MPVTSKNPTSGSRGRLRSIQTQSSAKERNNCLSSILFKVHETNTHSPAERKSDAKRQETEETQNGNAQEEEETEKDAPQEEISNWIQHTRGAPLRRSSRVYLSWSRPNATRLKSQSLKMLTYPFT